MNYRLSQSLDVPMWEKARFSTAWRGKGWRSWITFPGLPAIVYSPSPSGTGAVSTSSIPAVSTPPARALKSPLSISSKEYIQEIRDQALAAVQESDAILFWWMPSAALHPPTKKSQPCCAAVRRGRGKRLSALLLVVNKADNLKYRSEAVEFYRLGLGDPYPISAVHGTGTGDLLDALVAAFPPAAEKEEDDSVKIAIVGIPNAGKSSLLNQLVGEERAIVSPIAGTTRDAVDTPMTFNDTDITLIDTAGIRRRGKIDRGVEQFSVLRSMRAIERCDVALLMIDATKDISAQDAHIAGFIQEAGKSAVILVNKWDAVEKIPLRSRNTKAVSAAR
jgi:GTP-binding protein